MSSLSAETSRHQTHQAAIPQRSAALIAGLAYVVITVLSLFAISVLDGPTEPDDPAATVENILNSEGLFRSGLAAFVIVLIADVVVAWALYVFLQRASRSCRCSPPGSGCCMSPSPPPRCQIFSSS